MAIRDWFPVGRAYPKRVFPRARAEQVEPIRAFATEEQDGWVWVDAGDDPVAG
ncbi:MAG: hypothetical protein ACRDSE_19100 [Pseudonocardiaceae bacterium]